METIKKSSAEEATLEWLKAELNSERFSGDLRNAIKSLGYDESIITEAQLTSRSENEARWRILKSYRTWLDRDFDNYEWEQVELSREEVANLNYIDYSYWNELSGQTHKVGRAATNVAEGKIAFEVPNDRFFAVAEAVAAGTSLPPLVVVSGDDLSTGEILEGHLRATGYMLAQQTPHPLIAIWGKLRE